MQLLRCLLSLVLFSVYLLSAEDTTANEKALTSPTVKDFTLHSVADEPTKTFTLSAQRGKHVILHFLLKTTCPVCQRHTHEYAQKLKGNEHVVQVFIKPDEKVQIEKWLGKLSDRPAIYHDPKAALAKKYAIPDGYHFHGQLVHYPAFILLDPQGKEVFRYVGKKNGDRFTYQAFADKFPQLVPMQ